MAFLQQICKSFLEILYPLPKVCLLCRQNSIAASRICHKCASKLEIWQVSSASWTAFPVDKAHKSGKTSYRVLYAAAPYEGVFKQAIQRLKYGKQTYLAEVLGEIMASHLSSKVKFPFDMIVPVPLASRKEAQRGFNQSQLLAKVISFKLGIPLEKGLLLKSRETKTQASLKKDKRLENLKGVFTVTRKLLNSPSILLVDDIFTTGATVQEAALALRKAGAGRVEVAVWAKSIGY